MKPARGKPRSNAGQQAFGKVRIIGGAWRGSKLDVVDADGLRPTSDRARETLFNWLQHHLAGAACLDVFAGSGALGFEAASRGASRVTMIERSPTAMAQLQAAKTRLNAANVELCSGDALAWLAKAPERRYDIAFVDPPFAAGLHEAVLRAVVPWLAPGAFLYVECPAGGEPVIPAGFVVHREGGTRQARHLLLRDIGATDATVTLDSMRSEASPGTT